MHDVVIIGGGHAGMAVAGAWHKAGLSVAIVEQCCEKPGWWEGEWVQARGAVVSQGLVVALDPATSDERRLLPCHAIVMAPGRLETDSHSSRLTGITKLGAEFTPDKTQVMTDEHGRTRAPGVFAIGSFASTTTRHIIPEVIEYCTQKSKTAETVTP